MKIAFDAFALSLPFGGVPTYVRNLLGALLDLDRENEYLLLLRNLNSRPLEHRSATDDEGASSGRLSRVAQKPFPLPRKLLSFLWSTCSFPAAESFTGAVDLFHSPHILLPPLRRGKGVLTVHDLAYLKAPSFCFRDRREEFEYTVLLPQAAERASRIIVDSRSVGEDLQSFLSVPQEKIKVVPLGVSERFFQAEERKGSRQNEESQPAQLTQPGRLFARLPLLKDLPYFLCVMGTAQPRKNLLTLIEGFFLLKEEAKRSLLLVIVAEWEEILPVLFLEESRRKAIWLPFSPKGGVSLEREKLEEMGIFCTGRIEEELLPPLLQSCLAFVYPSRLEGFGLPALEAMAAGAPVAVSRIPALQETVGDAGLFFSPDSPEEVAGALLTLMEKGDLREELRRLGRERAKSFSWHRTAEATLAVYREAYHEG